MSVPAHKRAGAGSRRWIKYTEQPCPQAEPEAKRQLNEQLKSPLFKVPRDLRSRFFDLTFKSSCDTVEIGALFCLEESNTLSPDHDAVAPPTTPLILTCRRIFDECKNTFDTASSIYWHNDFVIKAYKQSSRVAISRPGPRRVRGTHSQIPDDGEPPRYACRHHVEGEDGRLLVSGRLSPA